MAMTQYKVTATKTTSIKITGWFLIGGWIAHYSVQSKNCIPRFGENPRDRNYCWARERRLRTQRQLRIHQSGSNGGVDCLRRDCRNWHRLGWRDYVIQSETPKGVTSTIIGDKVTFPLHTAPVSRQSDLDARIPALPHHCTGGDCRLLQCVCLASAGAFCLFAAACHHRSFSVCVVADAASCGIGARLCRLRGNLHCSVDRLALAGGWGAA